VVEVRVKSKKKQKNETIPNVNIY